MIYLHPYWLIPVLGLTAAALAVRASTHGRSDVASFRSLLGAVVAAVVGVAATWLDVTSSSPQIAMIEQADAHLIVSAWHDTLDHAFLGVTVAVALALLGVFFWRRHLKSHRAV